MSDETDRLEALVAEMRQLLATPTPQAFPAHVAPGELIESSWGNNVVDSLQYLYAMGSFAVWGGVQSVTTDVNGNFNCPLLKPSAIEISGNPAIVAMCGEASFGLWIVYRYGNTTSTYWTGTAYGASGLVPNLTFPLSFIVFAVRTS